MSFKTKRWGEWREVDMREHISGWKGYETPGAAGVNTGGWAVPFRGKIVVFGYAADDSPIYAIYDPASDSVVGSGSPGTSLAWYRYSPTFGNNAWFRVWRDEQLIIYPQDIGYYFALSRFCGFDADLGWHNPAIQRGDALSCRVCTGGIGVAGGLPVVAAYQSLPDGESVLTLHTIFGEVGGAAGPFYWDSVWGSLYYKAVFMEGYWAWKHEDGDAIYSSPPMTVDDPYISLGQFGTPTAGPTGGAWLQTSLSGMDPFTAAASNPLTPATPPWQSTWHYRQLQDGGYELSSYDLDGVDHSIAQPGPGTEPVTKCSNGWYAGVEDPGQNVTFTVYGLDPAQPTMQARRGGRAFGGTACFMGDYAIGDDLRLAHVLPLPGGASPSGVSTPPQERADGYIIGKNGLFQRQGNSIAYRRGMKTAFAGYSFGPDWWWPGENPDHTLDSTLGFFAGTQTVMGRYPDYMWGMLSPLGHDVSRGLGVPEENLKAVEPDPIYVVRNTQLISGTSSWVEPGATGYAVLRGSLQDSRLCYHEYYTNVGGQPAWHARGGLVTAGEWQTLVDFEEIDMPPLGNDDWTVMGLCTIPPCRGLPQGGWLVNAELYFAPWDSWEWDPGDRDLTFRDTGQGWVPAKWGYVGPIQSEDWHPRLLTGYDEWTFGRSDYGPAALMVFDRDGTLVECLNDETMYPPQAGREIAILPGGVPRLIYRVKGGGTYSDSAEGWGCYQNNSGEEDMQAPLFAVYELESHGSIQVGAGVFLGFVDMYELGGYEPQAAGFRWEALWKALDGWEYPKTIWEPYSGVQLREGIGGSGVTLLGGTGHGRPGVRGVGGRHLQ